MVKFSHNVNEGVFIASFAGRLDTQAVQNISEIIKANLPVNDEGIIKDRVAFDLRDVEYISSSFIRICVDTAKQVPHGRFTIIHCQPFIKKTFKISGLDEILNVS